MTPSRSKNSAGRDVSPAGASSHHKPMSPSITHFQISQQRAIFKQPNRSALGNKANNSTIPRPRYHATLPTRSSVPRCASTAEQIAFDQSTDRVSRNNMDLLNERRFICGRGEIVVAESLHVTFARAAEADGCDTNGPRRLQRRDDVRRTARRRDRDEHVASAAESAHLTLKRALETIVVTDRGEHRGIGRQRDRGQRIAVEIEPRQKLAGDVLGVGG